MAKKEDKAEAKPAKRPDPFYIRFRLTFTDICLGTVVTDRDIYLEHVLKDEAYAEDAEKLPKPEHADEKVDQQTTYFYVDPEGNPCLAGYQLKGFFKEASKTLKKITGTLSAHKNFKTNKSFIDSLVFVEPDLMPFHLPKGWTVKHLEVCERPLRAETAKGPRVSIARSLSVPAGTSVEGQIKLLVPAHEKWVLELLDYGRDKGLLQWRNSGKGRFIFERLGEAKDGSPSAAFENVVNLTPTPPPLPEESA